MAIDIHAVYTPMLLHDGLYNMIDMNNLFRKLYGLTKAYFRSISDSDPLKFNIARHIHDQNSPFRQTFGGNIEQIELYSVIYWRYLSLAYRHTQRFEHIQQMLLSEYETFAEYGYTIINEPIEKSRVGLSRLVETYHAEWGSIAYTTFSMLTYQQIGELYMITVTPCSQNTLLSFAETVS